jgi:hypothetical protein
VLMVTRSFFMVDAQEPNQSPSAEATSNRDFLLEYNSRHNVK